MPIQTGEALPAHSFLYVDANNEVAQISTDCLRQGWSVAVGVPGAFTPKCTNLHLPSFVQNLDEFEKRGVKVSVVAPNDHWVSWAWINALGAPRLVILSDWNAAFVRKLGLEADFSEYGMGIRSQRFALISLDGVVRHLFVDEGGSVDKTLAANVLEHLT